MKKFRSGAAALGLVLATSMLAQAQIVPVEIPDYEVNVPGHLVGAGTQLGTFIVPLLGVFLAFLVIKFGMKWARKIA